MSHHVTEEEIRAVEEHKALAQRCGVERVGDLEDGTGMLCSVPFAVFEELERLRSRSVSVPDIIASDDASQCGHQWDHNGTHMCRLPLGHDGHHSEPNAYVIRDLRQLLTQRDRRIAELEAALRRVRHWTHPGHTAERTIDAALAAPASLATATKDAERIYPCADCGVMRSKAEGGTTFTVCDDCWDKAYPKAAPIPPEDVSLDSHSTKKDDGNG